MMARYNRDPRWIRARYNGKCSECGAVIPKGAEAYYYPATRSILCENPCGQAGASAMRAERSMDRYGTDCALDY